MGRDKAGGLGWYPGPVDTRDLALAPRLGSKAELKTRGSVFHNVPIKLDQGVEGSCVGHAWTQLVNCYPNPHRYDHQYAYTLYRRAQELDEWEGSDYSGTSIRAGAKAAREASIISAFAFAADLEELALWILNHGPVVIGIDWWSGMDQPLARKDYFVEPTGSVRGGHAICVDGVRWEHGESYFRLLNSWGPGWGMEGRCRLSLASIEKLLSAPYATASTAVEAPKKAKP